MKPKKVKKVIIKDNKLNYTKEELRIMSLKFPNDADFGDHIRQLVR